MAFAELLNVVIIIIILTAHNTNTISPTALCGKHYDTPTIKFTCKWLLISIQVGCGWWI